VRTAVDETCLLKIVVSDIIFLFFSFSPPHTAVGRLCSGVVHFRDRRGETSGGQSWVMFSHTIVDIVVELPNVCFSGLRCQAGAQVLAPASLLSVLGGAFP
jgi:hypothetical protein